MALDLQRTSTYTAFRRPSVEYYYRRAVYALPEYPIIVTLSIHPYMSSTSCDQSKDGGPSEEFEGSLEGMVVVRFV